MPSLTAAERETIVNMDDATETATITTHQRSVITKLERNASAKLIERIDYGTTAGAIFELPAALISFRNKRREAPADASARMAKARAARAPRSRAAAVTPKRSTTAKPTRTRRAK